MILEVLTAVLSAGVTLVVVVHVVRVWLFSQQSSRKVISHDRLQIIIKKRSVPEVAPPAESPVASEVQAQAELLRRAEQSAELLRDKAHRRFKSSNFQRKPRVWLEQYDREELARARRDQPSQSVPSGTIVWNPPDRMKVGRREVIEIRLGDAAVAEVTLRESLRSRGALNVDHLEVAPTMRVTLVSDVRDFSIQELSSKDQYMRSGQVARWDFGVMPLRGGKHCLRLLVSMRVRVEGKDEMADLPSYEREVRVVVAPIRALGLFFSKNWQWVAGTVAIPLVVWATKDTSVGKVALRQLRDWLGVN